MMDFDLEEEMTTCACWAHGSRYGYCFRICIPDDSHREGGYSMGKFYWRRNNHVEWTLLTKIPRWYPMKIFWFKSAWKLAETPAKLRWGTSIEVGNRNGSRCSRSHTWYENKLLNESSLIKDGNIIYQNRVEIVSCTNYQRFVRTSSSSLSSSSSLVLDHLLCLHCYGYYYQHWNQHQLPIQNFQMVHNCYYLPPLLSLHCSIIREAFPLLVTIMGRHDHHC